MKYPSLPSKNSQEYKIHRRLEMVPGLLTWATLLGAVAISFLIPIAAAVIVILYDLFWLIKTIIISGHSIIAYQHLKKTIRKNWYKKCVTLKSDLRLKDIYHLIVIPYFSEGLEVLEPSIEAILAANYPKEKMIVVMTCEQRAGAQACRRKNWLKEKYGKGFKAFLVTNHPDTKGEMKVKAANTNWGTKKGVAYLKKEGISFDKVIVSTFDCDTCAHKEYFPAATYHFLASKNRYHESYQPLPMYNNNIWDTVSIVRVIHLSSSFWHMIESTRPERLVTFSSHSMSLKALIEVGYWQKDVISDDSAIFWQCYIHNNGNYRTVPLYIPVSMDATLASSFSRTLVNQYKQKRRWAYGIEHFPRIARVFMKSSQIPLGERIRHCLTMLEGHHSWATSSLLILMLGWLPLIIGGSKFNETVIAHNLPVVTRTILIIAMLGMIISMFLSFYLLPPKPRRYGKGKYAAMLFQWILVPIIAPFFGSLPAIDAQTRLMLGKYFNQFWLSEKVRKK